MSSFQPVRGTHDLLPDTFRDHKQVTDIARDIAARYGFREMAPPVFEFTQVFSRTMVGPIFFEFIQRKGDEGFGEGNFQALFELIERAEVA